MVKGGYIADYSTTANKNDYILYTGPDSNSNTSGAVTVTTNTNTNTTTPGLTNGVAKTGGSLAAAVNLPDNFLYSMDGGCAMCSGTTGGRRGGNRGGSRGGNRGGSRGGNNNSMKGGFALEPFISALALLGARMLADKEVGLFNNKKSSSSRNKSSKYDEDEDD